MQITTTAPSNTGPLTGTTIITETPDTPEALADMQQGMRIVRRLAERVFAGSDRLSILEVRGKWDGEVIVTFSYSYEAETGTVTNVGLISLSMEAFDLQLLPLCNWGGSGYIRFTTDADIDAAVERYRELLAV